ncbi:hypothetical protein [Fictibacillus phosphorivorans]|uniref:hypothetical protein n=1 Tax=Fictibacillus phosphorivorans TaxID=1221500 RepID=UPI0020405B54|nr:hypothetical protein [Fictibacillus phosphorivorans]MCM3718712.1 hypothetical protein [Fictibacillus phosphorivorans]MCM3776335.1 hypothetical protein [Fictibacillus phosphorivorans]
MFFIAVGVISYVSVMDYASEKAMSQIFKELSTNEDEINKLLEDPEIRKHIETGEKNSKNLPFTSRKEAVQLISEKYSVTELARTREQVSASLTEEEKEVVYEKLLEKFTEKELLAFKVVALKEINKKKAL